MRNNNKHLKEGANYKELVNLLLSVDTRYPIYYNDSWNVVNIGGTGYDKGELVKHFKAKPGQSGNIKSNFYYANLDPTTTKKEIEKLSKGKIKVDTSKGMVRYIKESIINEAIEPEDYLELRKLIRQEIASVFFDLFKKRANWIK